MTIIISSYVMIPVKMLWFCFILVCPSTGKAYIGDTESRCLFHICVDGNSIAQPCAPGSGTPINLFISFDPNISPCSEHLLQTSCKGKFIIKLTNILYLLMPL